MRCYLKKRAKGKGTGIWDIWHYHPDTGKCSKRSTHTRDHGEAQRKLAEYILSHQGQQKLEDPLLTDILLRYWHLHGKNCFGAGTVKLVMKRVADKIPEMHVAEFRQIEQQKFVHGLVPSTARRYLAQVFAALNWARNREELDQVPSKFRIIGQDRDGARPLKLAELQRLFEAAKTKRHQLFLLLALGTGQRPAHILELTWDRVHFDTGVINFQDPSRLRTKKVRPVVPMCPTLQAFLVTHKSIGPVIIRHGRRLKSHRMMFERLAKDAKVEGSAYGVRKAMATYLRRAGVPEMDLKGMLGHRLGGVTDRYAHLDPQFMVAAKTACETLLREVDAGWLRRFTSDSLSTQSGGSAASAGFYGAGKGARTLDLNLGKGCLFEDFQLKKAANDD